MIFDLPFFRGLTPLIRLELLPLISMFETFRVESCPAVGFAAYTRTKNADELDVVASPGLDQDPQRPEKESYESAVAAPSTHSGE